MVGRVMLAFRLDQPQVITLFGPVRLADTTPCLVIAPGSIAAIR
jgi:hypothetical protein